MKIVSFLLLWALPFLVLAQNNKDSTSVFKKRVLENVEIDILASYYEQDGKNAAVTGGIGTEELSDLASDIFISIPLNDDDVLRINATVSAYTSASSSNLNPFSGASRGEDDDDDHDDDEDDDYEDNGNNSGENTGTPWAASSGASRKDTWAAFNASYTHSSEDRNSIYSANLNFANEYDYTSFGAGIGVVRLFNQKNTELSLNTAVYLDTWRPEYPTEIKTFVKEKGDLNADFFEGVSILSQNGTAINKNAADAWRPFNTTLVDNDKRNTYSFSLGFSQILSKTTQLSVFTDITYQTGWLSNPMQRVYFADKDNFYIGNAESIPFYTEPKNKDVFQLADDIERLPGSRIKLPIGVRLNQYVTEYLVLRSYYRYYTDDWGIHSHTVNMELAIKLGQHFTFYPSYRFYNQTAATYFAPFEELVSSSAYYTSDFDLSTYHADQIGFSMKYTDIFTSAHLWRFGLKGLTIDYSNYARNTGLKAGILSFGAGFVFTD
ncbi:DUF3570 domain-containing protein [Cyclobacterium jeungdonense]|uniref:DUF3570 domain-containing protein n=1 Tax=Cyclobacterium jeungdonense TaxID=708087 RepID=A0ABT8CAG8_9BACT|nr:DUF3570 domain-containing protein [Cyclobacterium jeungdonense]MDN3689794.1 DUF3570 domain-containing protein [Cyclobacterium jeungdonense]